MDLKTQRTLWEHLGKKMVSPHKGGYVDHNNSGAKTKTPPPPKKNLKSSKTFHYYIKSVTSNL